MSPAAERRQYAGAAAATTLTADITSTSTSITVTSATGWPDGTVGPFFAVIDRGLASEEKVKFLSRTSNTLTVVTSPTSGRGADSTTAQTHSAGSFIEHCLTADDVDKYNAHVNDQGDNHPTLLNTARHDVTARHTAGTVLPVGTPGTSAVGDTPGQGASGNMARADHVHGREAFGSPNNSAPGDGAQGGSNSTLARSDHQHGRESFGTPGASAVADSTAAGTNTTLARSDHKHGREGFGTPSSVGTSNQQGSNTSVSRSDHQHTGAALGTKAYAEITANQGSLGAGPTDITGLSVTFTTQAGRRYRLSSYCPNFSSSGSPEIWAINLQEGATVLQKRIFAVETPGLGGNGAGMSVILSPSAGSHTYKVTASRASGSGSGSFNTGSDNPGYILLEDCGT